MKILIVSLSLMLGGGAEKSAANLGNALSKRGYNVLFLTFNDIEPRYEVIGEYNSLNKSEMFNNGILSNFKNLIINSYEISKICKKNEIDLIISIGGIASYNSILSKILFRNKSKIAAAQHSNPEIYFKKKVPYYLTKFLYPYANRVICVSKEIEGILKSVFKLKNTYVLYNMVNLDQIKKLSKEKINIEFSDSCFNFISIGRLSEDKGVIKLIDIFKIVLKKNKNIKLYILGEGEQKQKIQSMINDLNLETHIILLGKQKNVFKFLKRADCFVFCCIKEGFPMVLIEALSTNLPIISNDCKTGPRECLCPEINSNKEIDYPYFGNYGILVPPISNLKTNDKDKEIADIILNFIENNKLKEKYFKKSPERAYQFDEKIIVNNWIDLFKDLKLEG